MPSYHMQHVRAETHTVETCRNTHIGKTVAVLASFIEISRCHNLGTTIDHPTIDPPVIPSHPESSQELLHEFLQGFIAGWIQLPLEQGHADHQGANLGSPKLRRKMLEGENHRDGTTGGPCTQKYLQNL